MCVIAQKDFSPFLKLSRSHDFGEMELGCRRILSRLVEAIFQSHDMKILLYNPDNGVTRNFMPHLWMFLLQSLTPPEHEVLLIDGNARPMNEQQLVSFIRDQQIGLVGIGAMTRMVARAYRMADAIRAAGVPVVMGGPHVTEVPDEALGRDGGPRHADAVALGEADETWPQIVADAVRGELKEIYTPVDETGKERKPSLQPYPAIPGRSSTLNNSTWFQRSCDHCWSGMPTAGNQST